jgi:CDP-6-deoxy-D-xylo-4-hexulose-3-dehydrase
MDAIVELCERRNLILIEDCCEALGATYRGRPVGRFGRAGTFSFYYSHHMSTFEGGITVTDDTELAELMRILRAHGWVREVENRQAWLDRYPAIDPRFLFVNVGYNLRPMEISGAMGLVQLPKLAGYVETRRRNAAWFAAELARFGVFDMQEEDTHGESSWFGISLRLKPGLPFGVRDITSALNRAGIETRPIICGNIARQPALQLYPHRTVGTLAHADGVMERAFSFGNHQAICDRARAYIADQIAAFLRVHNLAAA